MLNWLPPYKWVGIKPNRPNELSNDSSISRTKERKGAIYKTFALDSLASNSVIAISANSVFPLLVGKLITAPVEFESKIFFIASLCETNNSTI